MSSNRTQLCIYEFELNKETKLWIRIESKSIFIGLICDFMLQEMKINGRI